MYQALYRKYRPKTFEDVVGQNIIVETLKNAVIKNRISHAYLFTGPRGTGKTSIAKIFAELVNCENSNNGIQCGKCVNCTQTNNKQNTDIIEIDAASNNGVDEIREIRNKVSLVPSYGKYKVYIIDEVHMLTSGAFNALLKTLEEPPGHVIFILATTEPHKIPITILSRCQRYDFKRVNICDIEERLKYISMNESINISDMAIKEIAILSDGGMRDSISMLDQAISYTTETINDETIHRLNGTLSFGKLKELMEQIFENKTTNVLDSINNYNDLGMNFYKLTEQIIGFMKNIVLNIEAPDYLKMKANINDYSIYVNYDLNKIIESIYYLNDNLIHLQKSNNPYLLFQLLILKLLHDFKLKTEMQDEKTINDDKTVDKHIANQNSVKNTQTKEPDKNLINKLINQRINNTLAKFDKKETNNDKQILKELSIYASKKEFGKIVSLIIDSEIKASSKENIIFVFQNRNDSTEFNNNITKIEKFLKLNFKIEKYIISTDSENWNNIKDTFNSKKIKYIYEEKLIDETTIFNDDNKDEIEMLFNDCIEYN